MNRQRGFTLIELMIGLLVGLIVLSAVGYTFLSTLRSSKDIVNSARLNRDASTITDIVVGELRRTGYFPVTLSVSGAESGFGISQSDLLLPDPYATDNTCVLYSYYDDDIASVAIRGFSWGGDVLSFGVVSNLASAACSTITAPLNDVAVVKITRFNVQIESCVDSSGAAASAATCQASSVSESYSRALQVDLEFEVAKDSVWRSAVRESVKLPNDLSPGVY